MNRKLLMLCSVLMLIMGCGAYYDSWRHVAGLVETFLTDAHLMIYASIFLVGMIVLTTVIVQMIRLKTWSPMALPFHRSLALAGAGSSMQLLSGVSDSIYHSIFGFDVTIWSPPHMGAIFGGVLTGIALTSLWYEQKESMLRSFFAIFTISVTMFLLQFSIAEYNFGNRFEQYPAWFACFETLFFGFFVLWFVRKGYKWHATFMSLFVWLLQLAIWYLWQPYTPHRDGQVSMYDFPYALFGGVILFELIFWRFARLGRLGTIISLLASALYFAGLTGWMVWNSGQAYDVEIQLWAIGLACIGAVIAFVLESVVSGYGERNWRNWFTIRRIPISSIITLLFPAVLLIFSHVFATSVLAHELEPPDRPMRKMAPDMEPWFVVFQFVLQTWLGYGLANLMLQFKRKATK